MFEINQDNKKMKENFNKEEWRDVDGYDGIYQVSDLGRVRSKKYGDWRVLRPGKNGGGYLFVNLCKDNNVKKCRVHRLVAQAFIPNSDETKTQINHKNEIKSDNRVSNLEWCDYRYNLTYNDIQFRKKNSKRRKIDKLYDPELSIDDNIKLFRSNGIECSRETVLRLRKDLGLSKKYTKRS